MTVGRIAFAAPWTADETRHGYDRVIRSAKRDPVALVQIAGWDKRSATANANLIAAAPELLAALKGIKATCPCDPDINPTWLAAWEALEAAIAKAEAKA